MRGLERSKTRGRKNIRRLFQYLLVTLFFPPPIDTRINSCSPESTTTKDSIFNTQAATYTTQMIISDSPDSASSTVAPYSPTPTLAPTSALASTSRRKRKLICVTEAFVETSTISTETESYVENKAAFKNEVVGFGGKSFLCLHCMCVCLCVYVQQKILRNQFVSRLATQNLPNVSKILMQTQLS